MKRLFGFLAALAAVSFWGISFISAKIVLDVFDPIVLGFFRYVLAVSIVLVIVAVKKISLKVTKRDFWTFVLAGFFGIFLFSSLENTALLWIAPESGAIMSSLAPLMILMANTIFSKERFNWRHGLYALISVFGVTLVVSPDAFGTSPEGLLGLGLMVLSIMSWTAYSLLTKHVTERHDTIKVTALQSLAALAAFAPALLFRPLPDFTAFDVVHWGHFLFLGIVCSAGAYLLFIHSIKVLGVTTPNVIINFTPIVTVLVGVLWYGATIGWIQVLGAALVVVTMTLITLDRTRTRT
jgi:drug/metabolite transporter (DMT)-like permease